MMRRYVAWSLLAALSLLACTETGSSGPPSSPVDGGPFASPSAALSGAATDYRDPLRLVTLGDSYTAGWYTPAPQRDGWPGQLDQAMRDSVPRLRLVGNLADRGETSLDVLKEQLPQVESLKPDVVTVQVGVNDIIDRETSLEDYRANVSAILDELILIVPPQRIFAITTPDHTLTTGGLDWTTREAGSAAVAEINSVLTQVAMARGIVVVDISPVNALVPLDPSLVIGDGPYPTAKQYAGWVEVIGLQVRRALTTLEP